MLQLLIRDASQQKLGLRWTTRLRRISVGSYQRSLGKVASTKHMATNLFERIAFVKVHVVRDRYGSLRNLDAI